MDIQLKILWIPMQPLDTRRYIYGPQVSHASEVLVDHNIACMQILALCKVVPWIIENYVWKSTI